MTYPIIAMSGILLEEGYEGRMFSPCLWLYL